MLARLRRVLQKGFSVAVRSDAALATEINARARQGHVPKTAAPYAPLAGVQQLTVRPIDLLRRLGEMTTPQTVNMARLSASWATRRYFWAIDDHPGTAFRLSQDARALERHQKTLLSDQFGVAFAGLLMEGTLGVSNHVDLDLALIQPTAYGGVYLAGSARPDYLMWNSASYFVVECKGSQSDVNTSKEQLRRGLEQLMSITFAPNVTSIGLVVATFMDRASTTLYVLDPPDDDPEEDDTERLPAPLLPVGRLKGAALERSSEYRWFVPDPGAFRTRIQALRVAGQLRWVGQHASARAVLGIEDAVESALPNQALETLETDWGVFRGRTEPLAPELGPNGPSLFRGVRSDLLDQLVDGQVPEPIVAGDIGGDYGTSIGPSGTCLAVRGLDIQDVEAAE